jgi:hypothetical protein
MKDEDRTDRGSSEEDLLEFDFDVDSEGDSPRQSRASDDEAEILELDDLVERGPGFSDQEQAGKEESEPPGGELDSLLRRAEDGQVSETVPEKEEVELERAFPKEAPGRKSAEPAGVSEEKLEAVVREVVQEVVERVVRETVASVAEKVIRESIEALRQSIEASDSQ